MANSRPPLTITPLRLSDIPPEESIVAAGRELIDSTDSWKTGKTYFTKVNTRFRPAGPSNPDRWNCRISEHSPKEVTFDVLWDKLAKNKAENEKKFITIIEKVTKVQELSPTAQIWTLYYNFPFPVSNRVFTVLQVVHKEDTALPSGLVISIPIDLSDNKELQKLEEKGVRARYVSVERVKQLENGNVEWRMATSSDPGGLIPGFLAEMSVPKKISEDVPHFLHWIEKLPKSS